MAETPSPDLFTERLAGTVTRVVYVQPEGRWAVVRLEQDDGGEATVVGELAPVHEGERLEADGSWVEDRRFGRQFRAARARVVRPDSLAGIERYLGSGAVPGIGPGLARRLVERFGARTLEVMDREAERLLEVPGIGPKRLAQIREGWRARAAERSVRVFLQGLGLGPALTDRVVAAWGTEAEARVRQDPYRLAAEVPGVGFRTADAVARRLGWAPDAEPRARAAIRHLLERQAEEGHCFVPDGELVEATAALLGADTGEVVRRALEALVEEGRLVAEPLDPEEAAALGLRRRQAEPPTRAVYLPAYHGAEGRVARRLAELATAPAGEDGLGSLPPPRCRRAVAWVERELGMRLGHGQRRALEAVLGTKVLLVTGGPGTGKTTLIDAVVRCAQALGARVALAAPTGRAANRLAQATGHRSQTLHRLLEYGYGVGFGRGLRRPLETDLVVVDEASMVDLFLMDALLTALPRSSALLLVGDADQLPPVGPGAVMRDLLAAGALATVRLREIYRQARRSLIVRNAHRVNAGELPLGFGRGRWGGGPGSDFYFVVAADGAAARHRVLELVTHRIPRRFGLDPRRHIQVLAPLYRGEAGVSQLNAALQRALNPRGPGRQVGEAVLRVGDRVMQQRNDYERDVFNGDVGWVVAVDEGGLVVEFEGRQVRYDEDNARELTLAYAISVHKSQGSEYPAVVIVLLPEHHLMLQRNLLYTALTRARDLAVLVGTRGAVARAVRNAAPATRYTRLARRLREALAAEARP